MTPEAMQEAISNLYGRIGCIRDELDRLDREYEEADITCCALSQDLLDELGISQEEAVRLAQLASIPEEVIDAHFAAIREKGEDDPPLPTPY